MPNYKIHLAAGGITFIALALALNIQISLNSDLLLWFLFCLFGSLFPDIDTKSKIQRLTYCVILLALSILLFTRYQFLIIPLTAISFIPLITSHRGLMHNFWFIIVFTIALIKLLSQFKIDLHYQIFYCIIFFLAGVLSHLWLDLGLRRMLSLPRFNI